MKKVGLIILAAVFLLGMYAPVSAADWDLYGSARVTTFWTDYSDDRLNLDKGAFFNPNTPLFSPIGDADTTQLTHTLQGNSRIGGSVDQGIVKGGFEYGTGVNVRLLYGTMDLGMGELLLGQHYVPLAAGSFLSLQAYGSDNNMLQFVGYTGKGASGRAPMIQLSANGFKVALVEVQESEDPEVMLPQLQVSYDMALDGAALNFGAGYQTYDIDNGEGDSLDSYMIAANSKLTMMDPMYVNFGGFYGQNVSNMGQAGDVYTIGSALVDPNTGDIEDIETYALLLVLGTKLDNNIGVEAGAGYRYSEADNGGDMDMMGYYLQTNIPLTDDGSVFIVPEIGYYDYEEGDETYAGLQWRVDF